MILKAEKRMWTGVLDTDSETIFWIVSEIQCKLTLMSTLSFGSQLRQLREEQDISLRELAKRVGVSGAFLSDVELGRRFPSSEIIKRIAKEIKVSVDELKEYDFRDEVETIRKMMFADPATGMAFRSITHQLQKGLTPEDLLKKISGKKSQ